MSATDATTTEHHTASLDSLVATFTKKPAKQYIDELKANIESQHRSKREEFIAGLGGDDASKNKVLSENLELCDEVAIGDWLPKTTSFPNLPPEDVSEELETGLNDLILNGFELRGPNRFTFVEGLLLKFVIARKFDIESATERFFHFRTLVFNYKLVFVLNDNIRKAMTCNVIRAFPPLIESHPGSPGTAVQPAKHRRVILTAHPRNINWDNMEVEDMQKTWFFCIMNVICNSFTAQSEGIVLQNSMKDQSASQFSPRFGKFLVTAMAQCLPIRVSAGFIGNQPFMFGAVMWPLLKNGISKKMRNRMNIMGTDYKPVFEALEDEALILEDFGGKLKVYDQASGEAQIKAMEAQHAACMGLKLIN